MRTKLVAIGLTFFCWEAFCQKANSEEYHINKFTESVFYITEVLFHDVVNPPAAARFYAYSTLAAHHIVSENFTGPTLNTLVKDYPLQPGEQLGRNIDPYFSATYSMLETAKSIIPSGYSLEEKQTLLYKAYLKSGVKKSVLDSSVRYAVKVAWHFSESSRADGYLKLSTLPRYDPTGADSTWFPTPPEYMAAVEPHWRTVRTFMLDSCNQFEPMPPVPFDVRPGSKFNLLMKDVYAVSQNLSPGQKLIANYWDCNPFANFYSGHVNVAIKKISPGGHWMNITGIACRKAHVSFARTVYTHALVAIGLHDGFVSCWDEKYQSHRVRPKTAINKFIDERWDPLLETPPFPEYTSGHSVISTISATLLSFLLGEDFSFTDTTEVMFGFSPRTFNSFQEAANEASISRLYGGIHYMDAIENGQLQGEAIGKFIIGKLKGTYAVDGR